MVISISGGDISEAGRRASLISDVMRHCSSDASEVVEIDTNVDFEENVGQELSRLMSNVIGQEVDVHVDVDEGMLTMTSASCIGSVPPLWDIFDEFTLVRSFVPQE